MRVYLVEAVDPVQRRQRLARLLRHYRTVHNMFQQTGRQMISIYRKGRGDELKTVGRLRVVAPRLYDLRKRASRLLRLGSGASKESPLAAVLHPAIRAALNTKRRPRNPAYGETPPARQWRTPTYPWRRNLG